MSSSREARAARMELVVDAWAAARAELESERDHHPGFADVRTLLGALYLEHGELEDALTEFEAAIAINSQYALPRFLRLVSLRQRDGALDPGLWQQEKLAERVEEPHRTLWTAWFLAQSGDAAGMEKALDHLEDERWSGLVRFYRWIWRGARDAKARRALQDALSGDSLYRNVLASRDWTITPDDPQHWNPASAAVYEKLGDVSARLGAPEGAEPHYEDAFLRHGDASRYELHRARLALGAGDEDRAVSCLRRAIELDPTSVDARIALGFEFQSQGYPQEAIVQFEVAARLRPRYADVQYNLGLLYEAQGRAEDAQRCFRLALEINPRYFQARTSLAHLLLHAGSHREALDVLRPLERQGIRSADLYVQQAEAHMALGQCEAAVKELQRAIELNPGYPRSYYVLGQAYRDLGLKRKAQEAWKQHLEKSRRWKEEQPVLEGEEWKP
ncbi:MAG: tetratricopeptide repeat protein [Candidatus Eisenbacteria bacterium]|uniref:Tetratricopeptide repeat protein n=1 Tax=Eiseniibacteriota bacterium TaxID=2212470 RepID=A0A956RPS2_UNCEI|nr:tetratricopeptide repeat protein [Candidatus Eisenbacteria bacterium]